MSDMDTLIIQGKKGIAYTLIEPSCERGNIFMSWDEEDARTKKSSAPCITSKEHQDYMDIKLFIRINELPFHFKSE